ncbi:MAG: SDR family oxidoreductase [Atopobiaceae bacterium]
MGKVSVICGGGSGMGLEAAKFLPKDRTIVLAGRTLSKLDAAVSELAALGIDAVAHTVDTSSRESVRALAEHAATLGNIANVIDAAGLSPTMADAEKIVRVNALGTVYVNQEFSRLMDRGSAILDISSNSAYALPKFAIPRHAYPLAETDEERFVQKVVKRAGLARSDYEKRGFAYAISKNFVVWYARKCAFDYGPRGIRVSSLSPGLVATSMGEREAEAGAKMIESAAEHRMGTPEELGFAIASCADERNGYLAGTDVLVDGGSTARKWH